jgi:hypothetical protein
LSTKIITTIPVCNGEKFIVQTLESIARQTLRPDRVVVIDNCSTDRTRELVKSFPGFPCEFTRNPANLGLFQNFNRCLDFAPETEFLHILHADDTIKPEFYQAMTTALAGVQDRGQAWCIDERIDENNRQLSFSGKEDGAVESLTRDQFLQRKAEIGNQAFCATLLRTNYQPSPCLFPLDYPILGDMIFWAAFGAHCDRIVHVHRALANYRWHGSTETVLRGPTIQSLIFDEWRTMETNEALRGRGWSAYRKMKLKGLLAVRSGIKAKRVRQNGDPKYSKEIVRAATSITGQPIWLAGQVLVELRDFYLFKLRRRTRHPKNIYG